MSVAETSGASAGEVVITPHLCRTCGYDLRGLNTSANCPECATPIFESLDSSSLDRASPDWLRKLRIGCLIYGWAVATSMVTWFIIIFVSMLSGIASATTGSNVTQKVQLTGTILGMAVGVISFIGAWMVTERDPARTDEWRLNARVIARVGIICYVLMTPWTTFAVSGGSGLGSFASTTAYMIALGALGIFGTAISVIGWAAYFHHVAQLFARLPSRSLAAQAVIVKWGYAIATAVTSLTGFATMIILQVTGPVGAAGTSGSPGVGGAGVHPLLVISGLTSCAGFIPFLGFEIWAMALHFVLASRLRSATA